MSSLPAGAEQPERPDEAAAVPPEAQGAGVTARAVEVGHAVANGQLLDRLLLPLLAFGVGFLTLLGTLPALLAAGSATGPVGAAMVGSVAGGAGMGLCSLGLGRLRAAHEGEL